MRRSGLWFPPILAILILLAFFLSMAFPLASTQSTHKVTIALDSASPPLDATMLSASVKASQHIYTSLLQNDQPAIGAYSAANTRGAAHSPVLLASMIATARIGAYAPERRNWRMRSV